VLKLTGISRSASHNYNQWMFRTFIKCQYIPPIKEPIMIWKNLMKTVIQVLFDVP